jgi:hypothetical protein
MFMIQGRPKNVSFFSFGQYQTNFDQAQLQTHFVELNSLELQSAQIIQVEPEIPLEYRLQIGQFEHTVTPNCWAQNCGF